MKITKKISLCAILTALAFIVLLLGAFFDTVTLSTAAIASIFVMIAVAELGYMYSAMVYAATAVIAFLLLPSKDPFILFSCFFGYYPILKSLCEKLKRNFSFLLKGIVFTVGYLFIALIGSLFFVVVDEYVKILFVLFPFFLAVFYLFDYAFTKLISLYCQKLRKRLGIDSLLK